MSRLGLDVSDYQPALPWPQFAAAGRAFAIVQVSKGTAQAERAAQHIAGAVAAGLEVAYYHFLTTADGVLQARNFARTAPVDHTLLFGRYPRYWVDVERETNGALAGVLTQFMAAWKQLAGDAIGIYTGQGEWDESVGDQHTEFGIYPLWNGSLPLPAGWQVAAIQQNPVAWHLPGYAGEIDLDTMTDIGAPYGPDPATVHLPLGPHHLQGGSETGKWLLLEPAVAKFVDDLGASVDAHAATLTVGRANDQGKLLGQGFDVNRYLAQGVTPAQALSLYTTFLLPSVRLNPHILCWEGPNEQILTTLAAMTWYAEFCYLFAAWLAGLGKRAAVGSWASGTPDPSLWPAWTRGLQASRDFGALQAYHSYSDDPGLPQVMSNQTAWAALGYGDCTHLISELGANQFGGGWKALYGDFGTYWNKSLVPFLNTIYGLPFNVLACLYTDGTAGDHAWDGLDVSGTNVVQLAAAYAPPKESAMPLTAAQKSDLLNRGNQLIAAINALVPDDGSPQHSLTGWTGQQVINFFYKVFGDYAELSVVGMPSDATALAAWRKAPYTGPAIEEMALPDAQKAALIAALPAG